MMMRFTPAILLLLVTTAFAQTPPTTDAVLIAGASPSNPRATDVAMQPLSIALAPDGTLYLADLSHVSRVDRDGTLHSVSGPWENPGGPPRTISALAADTAG